MSIDKQLKMTEILLKSNHRPYFFSHFACQDREAHRRIKEEKVDYRTPFAIDRDRILYSGAYRRYHGKTQVISFSNMIDEEMSNRNLHTTYVAQISRTIGRILGLNLDLIEAIALGHDLGHTPFGHDGERALSLVCQKHQIGYFHHNLESLQIVDNISQKGNGLNLTFQVRDGIISHDGELHQTKLTPHRKKTEQEIQEYALNRRLGSDSPIMPATLEACIVRISDTIAYIGQDIEDAIRYRYLKREEIPSDCQTFLGDTNGKIINSLVTSVILNSYENDYISFDDETSYYLKKLKDFNYQYIYRNQNLKSTNKKVEICMDILFDKYLHDLKNKNVDSNIYNHFLKSKTEKYLQTFLDAEKVRDFIATMTDRYFNEEIKDYLLPWK